MAKSGSTGRNSTPRELEAVDRLAKLPPSQHPSAIAVDNSRLTHINTYGALPDYYVDRAREGAGFRHPRRTNKLRRREMWRRRVPTFGGPTDPSSPALGRRRYCNTQRPSKSRPNVRCSDELARAAATDGFRWEYRLAPPQRSPRFRYL